MRIAAIIQARMSSTRLPGKTLMPLAGRPLISHVVDRISACRTIDRVVLATTVSCADDPLAAWADAQGVFCFRGSEGDVLGRYRDAARASGAEIIARVTADDPFKDPEATDEVVCRLVDNGLDFAYNNHPPSFPEGLDAEVFTLSALERAARESSDPWEREHVTQYFYRHPQLFRQENVSREVNLSHLRWTLDTEADYRMATAVYDRLYGTGRIFLMDEILRLLRKHPEIASMNANEVRSAMYRTD